MGVSTESDICKNVVCIGSFDIFEKIKGFSENDENGDEEQAPPVYGWSIGDYESYGKHNSLYGFTITKNYLDRDFKVICINSHEYSRVGEIWNIITSEDAEAVELFISDFEKDILENDSELDLHIEDEDAIQQTG